MKNRESVSPLRRDESLWDSAADVPLGEDYQAEVYATLVQLYDELKWFSVHPSGSVELFNEHLYGRTYGGYILYLDGLENQSVTITNAPSTRGRQTYSVAHRQQVGDYPEVSNAESVSFSRSVVDRYTFVALPEGIVVVPKLEFKNTTGRLPETYDGKIDDNVLADTQLDIERFTIYSLYKINRMIDLLET